MNRLYFRHLSEYLLDGISAAAFMAGGGFHARFRASDGVPEPASKNYLQNDFKRASIWLRCVVFSGRCQYICVRQATGFAVTKSEFQKKVMDILNRNDLFGGMKERILPLLSITDSLSKEDMEKVYNLLKEAVEARREARRLSGKLNDLLDRFESTVREVSDRVPGLRPRIEGPDRKSLPPVPGSKRSKQRREPEGLFEITPQSGRKMQYNKHPFPGGKPNFGLKLNKLFSAFITEYGPDFVTLIISDSILYTNNLILRISLHKREVLIGSSRSLKLYESSDGTSFLVTDKPEVIPYGSTRGFFYKNITYEDILNLTNGDFYKVFDGEILDTYKPFQAPLPEELKKVGYYQFD